MIKIEEARLELKLCKRKMLWREIAKLRSYSSAYCRLFGDEHVEVYLDLEQLHRNLSSKLERVVHLLNIPISFPVDIFLVDSAGVRFATPIETFGRSKLIIDAKSLFFLSNIKNLYRAMLRESISQLLCLQSLHDYPLLLGALAEYFARTEDYEFQYELAAYAKEFSLPSLDEMIAMVNKVPLGVSAIFSLFMVEHVNSLEELVQFISKNTHRRIPFLIARPSLRWILENITQHTLEELDREWNRFITEFSFHLDQDILELFRKKLRMRLSYENSKYHECFELCKELAELSEKDPEPIFYLISTLVRLGAYRSAVEKLLQMKDTLSDFYRGWAYLYLGQLYDSLQHRDLAIQSYIKAQEYSDIYGIIKHRSQRYISKPFVIDTQTSAEWVPFEEKYVRLIQSPYQFALPIKDSDIYLVKFFYRTVEGLQRWNSTPKSFS